MLRDKNITLGQECYVVLSELVFTVFNDVEDYEACDHDRRDGEIDDHVVAGGPKFHVHCCSFQSLLVTINGVNSARKTKREPHISVRPPLDSAVRVHQIDDDLLGFRRTSGADAFPLETNESYDNDDSTEHEASSGDSAGETLRGFCEVGDLLFDVSLDLFEVEHGSPFNNGYWSL